VLNVVWQQKSKITKKDERPTSNIERPTSNNDVAFSRRSQPTPPKWLRRPDRLLWRSLPAPQIILKSNEKTNTK
jgi:hypothetical protein